MAQPASTQSPVAQNKRDFQVLCVSKRRFPSDEPKWEEVINAMSRSYTMEETAHGGLVVALTYVEFQGLPYKVVGVSTGLSSSAVVLTIYNHIDPDFPLWDLYTNMPSRDGVTVEDLEDLARRAVRR